MTLLRTLLMPLLLLLALPAWAETAHEEKVVYHFSDSANAMMGLRFIRNHIETSPNAHIVVVGHYAGIDFLLKDAKDSNGVSYAPLIRDLAARHVEFRVCNNTLKGRGLGKEKVTPEATIVPSGIAEIARLQTQEGYAYIKP